MLVAYKRELRKAKVKCDLELDGSKERRNELTQYPPFGSQCLSLPYRYNYYNSNSKQHSQKCQHPEFSSHAIENAEL
jgi:hypothetical protein